MKKFAKKRYPIFEGYLDDGEFILHVAHRHVFIFLKACLKSAFFGLFLPILGYFIFPELKLIIFSWLLVGFGAVVYHFIDYYYDVWILTNQGVIDIDRKGLFDISTTRIDYHMMEGTLYNIRGFWQTMFQYGDITIDKMGTKICVILNDAMNPKKLERKLMAFQEKYVSQKSFRDHSALKDMLSGMIAYHVQNNKIDVNDNS